jgi:hypothetical protein
MSLRYRPAEYEVFTNTVDRLLQTPGRDCHTRSEVQNTGESCLAYPCAFAWAIVQASSLLVRFGIRQLRATNGVGVFWRSGVPQYPRGIEPHLDVLGHVSP